MKKILKKALSIMLVVVITLTAAPLSGFVGLELPEWLDFSIDASATESDFSYSILSDGTIKIIKYNGSNVEIVIPNIIDGKQVTAIGDTLFSVPYGSTSSIVSVEIPEGVTSLGEGVFVRCTSLKTIILPKTLISIGRMCFFDLGSLTINFCGSSVEWSCVTKGESWNKYSRLTVNYDFERPTIPKYDPTFAGGDGSQENPYQVATAEQLNNVRNNPYAYYVQTANIDIGDYSNWVPIGDMNIPFQGGYNGNNYTINNLSITDVTHEGYFGLFGVATGPVNFDNINLININIDIKDSTKSNSCGKYYHYSSANYVYAYGGSILAVSYEDIRDKMPKINNCNVQGNISIYGIVNCEDSNMCDITIGGITGAADTINNCTSNILINVIGCDIRVGGVVGEYGDINNCINYGDINCNSQDINSDNDNLYCGGICGTNSYGSINNSKNHGNLTVLGKNEAVVGGICGRTSSTTKVFKCVNQGNIIAKSLYVSSSASGVYVGGIIANDSSIESGNVDESINYGNLSAMAGDAEGESTSSFPAHCYCGGIVAKNNSGTIKNCYNYGLEFIGTSKTDASAYTPNIGRICGRSSVDKLQNNYSVDRTTLNGIIPNTDIGSDKINGAPLTTQEPITPKIKFGADKNSFGKDITGNAGDATDCLVVYTSAEYDTTSLTVKSSNSNVVSVGTISHDVGGYIGGENDHKATVKLNFKSKGTATITVTSPEGVSESIKVTVEEKEKSIAVFSTSKSFVVKTSESMWLGFGIMVDGKMEEDWKKMAVSLSDPTVASLSPYEETEYGYSLKVIGKKEGSTNLTITDTETGLSTIIVVNVFDEYTESYSYDISDMVYFYPSNKWESTIKTNIYDMNGIYVNNYSCTKSGNKYYVSFDAYNQRYHHGVVDIYDAAGNWIGSEQIEKYSDISSLYDTGEQIYYMIFGGNWMTYQHAMHSKKSHIEIEVPDGGYFTISNNYAESPGCFLYNSCEIFYEGVSAVIDVLTGDVEAPFVDLVTGNITDNKATRELFYELFIKAADKEIREYSKNILEGNIDDAYRSISGLLENMLYSLDIDWKHLLETASGLGESAFEKFAGPAGLALKSCFGFAEALDRYCQVLCMGKSINEAYATVYSSIDEGYINPHGVIVDTNGNMDAEAILQVFRISNDESVDVILDSNNPLEHHELYNICFVKDDKLVQPNGKVKVYVPIPEGVNSNTCVIYRQETEGSWTILDAKVEGNYLVFETDHFSLYALVGDRAELTITSLPNKLIYTRNELLDTTGLVIKLNGKTITEGYYCSPTVMYEYGKQIITVKYGKATTQFEVNVLTSSEILSNISVYSTPTKTTYIVGESFDANGLKIKLTYSDGSTEIVSTGYTVSGFSSTTAGTKTVTVTYGEKSTTFTVTVTKPTTYTLSYNANGGSGAPANQTGSTSYTISSTVPTRFGYTFLGWSKSSSSSTATYLPGDTISLSSNTTLYAVWKSNTIGGTCGENATWTFDETTGTLTISGTGDMYNYYDEKNEVFFDRPWKEHGNNIKTVVIEKGITSIGDGAFIECGKIENITLPETLSRIGIGAFAYCESIEEILIPNNVTQIDKVAFYGCCTLASINIPKGITIIETGTFYYCTNLTNIAMPNTVTLIGDSAFMYCTGLTEIIIPDSVTVIDSYAFSYCRGVEDVTIGNSVTTIGNDAFRYCVNLKTIHISNNVKSIEIRAFYDCEGLTDIYFSGTKSEWSKIVISNYNVPLLNAIIHYEDNSEEPNIPEEPEYNYTFSIKAPSMTEIRHKDGIKLHTELKGTAPEGTYVEWSASNSNFKTEEINGGNSLKIVSDKNGKTTFTATLYDIDGKVLATDTIEMNSKAGFFDKIGSFFRSIFGGTKIHES